MFETRISLTLSIALLLVASLCGACSKSAPAETSNANPSVSPSPQNSGIEVEIVTAKPIEWAITASGKILVTEDRVATIGPIHGDLLGILDLALGLALHALSRQFDAILLDIMTQSFSYLRTTMD